MCSAIVSGLLRRVPYAEITVVDPDIEAARRRLNNHISVVFHTTPGDVGPAVPDLVLLAVKPQHLDTIAADDLKPWRDTLLVSILAGKSMETITRVLGFRKVVRVMPNLPALIGCGMSVGFTETEAISPSSLALVRQMFEAVGKFEWVANEELIDACTAISGSGPGFLFAFAEQLAKAGISAGIPKSTLDKIVAETIYGSAALLLNDGRGPETLKAAVASKGGTTEAGLNILEADDAFPRTIPAAVSAAIGRSRELSGR